MAKNRFKQAKKEDAIKAIFSSDTENTLIETPSSPIEISDTVEILNNPPINIDTIQKISDNLDAPTVIKMDKLGVSIKTISKKRLDKLSLKLRRKPNNVVTLLLDNLYDEDTKTFKVDFPKKDTSKITSYHMKKDHINAINKLSKRTGHNKSELFNMLLELALSVEEQ